MPERLIDEGRVAAIVGGPEEFKPLVVDGAYLYLQKMRALEERFADSLRRRIERDDTGWPEAEVAAAVLDMKQRPAVRGSTPLPLSDDQLAAGKNRGEPPVDGDLRGPGTGKTTIVVSILRVLRRLGIPAEAMLLAAPTGKAARRLGQIDPCGPAGGGRSCRGRH